MKTTPIISKPAIQRPSIFKGFKIDIKLASNLVSGEDFSLRPKRIKKLLLVEDQTEVCNALAKRLKRYFSSKSKRYPLHRIINGQSTSRNDLSIIYASSSKEIEWLERHLMDLDIDLLFLDYNLEDAFKGTGKILDGVILTDKFRDDGFRGWIISISSSREARNDMVARGADFGVSKPQIIEMSLELLDPR